MPLHAQLEVARLLLSSNAALNARLASGRTALEAACEGGFHACVRLLVESDVCASDATMTQPLALAREGAQRQQQAQELPSAEQEAERAALLQRAAAHLQLSERHADEWARNARRLHTHPCSVQQGPSQPVGPTPQSPPALSSPTLHAVTYRDTPALSSPTLHAVTYRDTPALSSPTLHAVTCRDTPALSSPTLHAVTCRYTPALSSPTWHSPIAAVPAAAPSAAAAAEPRPSTASVDHSLCIELLQSSRQHAAAAARADAIAAALLADESAIDAEWAGGSTT